MFFQYDVQGTSGLVEFKLEGSEKSNLHCLEHLKESDLLVEPPSGPSKYGCPYGDSCCEFHLIRSVVSGEAKVSSQRERAPRGLELCLVGGRKGWKP